MLLTKKLFSKRLKLRLIETSDLSAIHNLHSLVETDEFNTLEFLKTVMRLEE
jgi:hypothetical protein